ncbi:MAG TPA: DNA polymerase III subunit alpha [Sandaracinaceae bacterium LLY-WYZ-13_1]|nr:DNA polymerase III subunit alpha [Sandaracinaceae bacterium LLY-WYZ-13_1]
MPDAELVHLHVHSEFSMLDGAIRLDGLVESVRRQGMRAVALTDHDNMHGAVRFHRACQAADVAPILGCEVHFTPGDRADPSNRTQHHLVLLASSQRGYENLVRLVSLGWVEGAGRPRIDFDLLRAHHAGVVGMSACMGGYVAQEILLKGEAAGGAALGKLKECFDPGMFFVELQDHGFPEQGPLNEILVEQAQALDLPLVATNDCHYLLREQARSQLALQCIGAGRPLADMQRAHHGSDRMFLQGPDEMAHTFRHLPEALKNTLLVAEMCGGAANPLSDPKLPSFSLPEGMSEADYLRKIAYDGLHERFEELRTLGREPNAESYHERLEIELGIIESMGFPGYFLIVQDFIVWAKKAGIPVGPGRGSGAGSLVAYSLRITDLDPIHHGLLFERFLNPERVSMPDFDVDFCMDRRDGVIDYVRDKYGEQSVGQIATFHQLKSKSVVRDVGRVMGMTPADAGRIASLIPEAQGGKTTPIDKALEEEPRLKATYEEDPGVKDLLDTAMQLENLNRHAGMHAAGVVISEGPLWDHVPVFTPEPDVYVTQYDKDDVEAAGLVKFDFLGLKTLTVIDIAVGLIDKRPDREGRPFDINAIPMDDAATFRLLQSGETTNVFQLESSGMQGLFRQLRPDSFEDIVAAVALYRPGPLGTGMVEDFVQRKHGRVKVEYPHPCLEGILKDTYGVIVYQEQVMQIAREMAGYTLGGADILRRAMGKKKESEMAKQRVVFVEGAQRNGHGADEAGRIFDLVAHFAGYGFNKSHSAAYALITYQTAYLKAHYPVEFVAATLTADKDKTDKVVRTVAEARSMGITVLPPDVNESEIDFTVVYDPNHGPVKRRKDRPVSLGGKVRDPMGPRIRFGLGGVKGIGTSALEAIFEARAEPPDGEPAEEEGAQQPFTDLFDFTTRVDLKRVNKGVAEALVQCGAFDTVHERLGVDRASAHAAIEAAIERGRRASADREAGQTSLFGLLEPAEARAAHQVGGSSFPEVEPWDLKELLAREKATLGFYVSGHPLERYASELRRFCDSTTAGLTGRAEGSRVTIGGSVEGYRERNTKSGGKMAFFHLEDPEGRVEVIVRTRTLDGAREALTTGDPVLLTADVKFERDRQGGGDAPAEAKLILLEAAPLATELRARTKSVRLRLFVERTDRGKLAALKKTLEANPGPCPVTLELRSVERWVVAVNETGLSVEPSEAFLSSLERLFGEKVCELR